MRSSWFVQGSLAESIVPDREVARVGEAFLPDVSVLPTGVAARALGESVRGVLFEATGRGAARIAAVPGAALPDDRASVVLTADGGARRARTCLAEAASAADAAADAVLPRAIFAYGTLRTGEEREGLLRRPGVRLVREARIPGRLVDLGAYPGLVPSRGAGDTVAGELFDLDDPRALLPELDEVEDFVGYDDDGSLYRRSLVAVPTLEGAALAWVYVYVGETTGAPLIASGDWKRR